MVRRECNNSSVNIEELTQEHKEVTSQMKVFFPAVGCVNLEGMAREY